jgi:hypothetical protein
MNHVRIRWLCLLLGVVLLGACHADSHNGIPTEVTESLSHIVTDTVTETVADTATDTTALTETDEPPPSDPPTFPVPSETIPPETTASDTAASTVPPPTDTLPPPAPLPQGMSGNITAPDALALLQEIAAVMAAFPDASVYFTDVEETYWFGIGQDVSYHSASTVKAAYCQYLLATGKPLTEPIQFTASTRTSSSGKLGKDAVGQTFTLSELIAYTIRDSDNQAYRLLYDTYGVKEYNRYVTSLGAKGLSLTTRNEWINVTARELSLAMLAIYRTGEEDPFLVNHLKKARFGAQIAAGTLYEVAHKYGYNGGTGGYHDTAIVYAPQCPYVLTIMTHIDIDAVEDENALFRGLTGLCDRLQTILFPATT